MPTMLHLAATPAAGALVAAFLGSFVEFVEASTIVLAVGTVRGWRPALIGAAGGAVALLILVAALGPALARVPLPALQLVVGVLLLLFGMRWLRKAVLRGAGVLPLHDEAAAFGTETASLEGRPRHAGAGIDPLAVVTTFKAVLLEGVEVVFIVIGVGATGGFLGAASLGAAVAGLLVLGAAAVLHRPLARVPENSLKLAVGTLIAAFGIFWVGEGLGVAWPGGDLALLGLVAALLATAWLGVRLCRPEDVRAGDGAPR